MSDDTGVYILKLKSADPNVAFTYRIAHVAAIDSVLASKVHMFSAFSESEVYYNYNEAVSKAELLDKKAYSEFGVLVIDYQKTTWDDIVIDSKPRTLN